MTWVIIALASFPTFQKWLNFAFNHLPGIELNLEGRNWSYYVLLSLHKRMVQTHGELRNRDTLFIGMGGGAWRRASLQERKEGKVLWVEVFTAHSPFPVIQTSFPELAWLTEWNPGKIRTVGLPMFMHQLLVFSPTLLLFTCLSDNFSHVQFQLIPSLNYLFLGKEQFTLNGPFIFQYPWSE